MLVGVLGTCTKTDWKIEECDAGSESTGGQADGGDDGADDGDEAAAIAVGEGGGDGADGEGHADQDGGDEGHLAAADVEDLDELGDEHAEGVRESVSWNVNKTVKTLCSKL